MCQPELDWRLIFQTAMWTFFIVMPPPSFHDNLRFGKIIEPFDIQALIAQPAVETLAESILPWTARFDVQRLNASTC